VHYLLSYVYQQQDLQKVIANALNKGIISHTEKDVYLNYIQNILSHPESIHYFNGEDTIKTEQEILLETNELIRLDRICISKDNVVKILDYKTGEKHDKYKQQILKYMTAFKALGYENVRGALLYTTFNTYETINL
jgi:Domain of unknown function DUF83